jgi:hypothetical protein
MRTSMHQYKTYYVIIPEGFPGAREIALLQKASYGTKQGARWFYDFTVQVLIQIGLDKCPQRPLPFSLPVQRLCVFPTQICGRRIDIR